AEGVDGPLSSVLADFRFILLPQCGHRPWIERYARDRFFKILST
ncbi:MAG: alpha/beta hydrolase, partial [Candidatus Aminicenantes bacterium]|nr:alpha/beta hydrolase [Candidatus Aminicenantes bacterium]